MFRYVPGEQLTEQCKIYYSEKWKKNIYTNIGGDAAAAVVVAGADDHGDDDNHSGGGGGDYDDGDNGNKDNAALVLSEKELYLACWRWFSRRILQGPPKATWRQLLYFSQFSRFSRFQLYFDEVFFFVCNLLRTALDL